MSLPFVVSHDRKISGATNGPNRLCYFTVADVHYLCAHSLLSQPYGAHWAGKITLWTWGSSKKCFLAYPTTQEPCCVSRAVGKSPSPLSVGHGHTTFDINNGCKIKYEKYYDVAENLL